MYHQPIWVPARLSRRIVKQRIVKQGLYSKFNPQGHRTHCFAICSPGCCRYWDLFLCEFIITETASQILVIFKHQKDIYSQPSTSLEGMSEAAVRGIGRTGHHRSVEQEQHLVVWPAPPQTIQRGKFEYMMYSKPPSTIHTNHICSFCVPLNLLVYLYAKKMVTQLCS